jgi:hypothetical protein
MLECALGTIWYSSDLMLMESIIDGEVTSIPRRLAPVPFPGFIAH